jgi:dCMP deaminase
MNEVKESSNENLQERSGSLVKSTGPNLNKWDRRFFRIAEEISHWSKDIGTKVGCVLVANRHIISCGFNGFPEGIADLSDRFEDREWKLAVTVHAEVNAILNAGKHGARTEGSTLYTTFSPCSNCSSAIIQAGITRVVCPPYLSAPERWRSNFLLGRSLLDEAGISITET